MTKHTFVGLHVCPCVCTTSWLVNRPSDFGVRPLHICDSMSTRARTCIRSSQYSPNKMLTRWWNLIFSEMAESVNLIFSELVETLDDRLLEHCICLLVKISLSTYCTQHDGLAANVSLHCYILMIWLTRSYLMMGKVSRVRSMTVLKQIWSVRVEMMRFCAAAWMMTPFSPLRQQTFCQAVLSRILSARPLLIQLPYCLRSLHHLQLSELPEPRRLSWNRSNFLKVHKIHLYCTM